MYLKLNFKNAGLILASPSIKTKLDDITTSFGGVYTDRDIRPVEDILVPKHCAINMVHVLCGLPPVPHYRESHNLSWCDDIVEAIDDSYIKYDYTPKFETIVKDDGTFYYKSIDLEMLQSAKVKFNSHAKHTTPIKCPKTGKTLELQGIHTWSAWRRYLGHELMSDVITYIEDCLCLDYNDIKDKFDLVEVITMIKDIKSPSYVELNAKLVAAGKTPISKVLVGDFSTSNYNSYNSAYPHINLKGVKNKLSLNGDMLIKLSEDMYDMINDNDGFATLLDDGVVTIVDVLDDIDNQEVLEYEGWVKIGTV